MGRTFITLAIMVMLLVACNADQTNVAEYKADVVTEWNKILLETAIAEDNLLTLKGVRTAAMAHAAMHDALNSIQPEYSTYIYQQLTPTADPVVAAVYAAYAVAVDQYPDREEAFNTILSNQLTKAEGRAAISKNLGQAAAKAVLENRKEDEWNGEADYTWHPMAPGVYAEFNEHSGTPEGFVFGAGWAAATPFVLPEAQYFRSPPPPDIKSAEYTTAFNEVKMAGGAESIVRTVDQTHLALWWKEFVESSHNTLLRELVSKEQLNLWQATRSYALMNMAIYDAYINVFDNKFHYNHWRPYTAIRWAENDENPDTEPNAEWNNLHKHTYPFPSYPSAHGTASTSAMTVMANTLGKGDQYAFTMTQTEVDSAGFFSGKMKMNPPTRSFKSFSEAGLEASMSRVYLGIHFRYDSEEGHRLGAKVGNYVVDNYLRPIEDR